MNIENIFDEVSNQMYSELEKSRKSFSHPGMKGNSAENTFRDFLIKYLPKNLDVSTGIIVDVNGEPSKQLDVIISDAAKTPIFYESNEQRVIPVECVYSVIEVKTKLDKKELKKSFENMRSVRKLKKTAYTSRGESINYFHEMYGKKWEIWPVNYFIFSYESINPEKLLEQIDLFHEIENLPPYNRIDCVCILNKGVICNFKENKIYALPDDESELIFANSENSLLLFYTLIMHYLNQVGLPYFNFTEYLGNIKLGNINSRK